ncbi:putative ATP-dependent DNA helicase Q1 [Amphiura filiformis]|uniref:putative ATP-dependent DNA helicase Q1 n=1 Tax=Amphiura filiformis TaxID=82378 RepID=UPI003B21A0DD
MEHIHNSFSQEDGTVRVLFSTVAFGMGVDVKGLHTVVHFGSPEGTNDYLQETGRAGRQGEESVAVLMHHSKAFVIRKPSKVMKEYVANETLCRRKKQLQDFGGTGSNKPSHTYTCCDVCD